MTGTKRYKTKLKACKANIMAMEFTGHVDFWSLVFSVILKLEVCITEPVLLKSKL